MPGVELKNHQSIPTPDIVEINEDADMSRVTAAAVANACLDKDVPYEGTPVAVIDYDANKEDWDNGHVPQPPLPTAPQPGEVHMTTKRTEKKIKGLKRSNVPISMVK